MRYTVATHRQMQAWIFVPTAGAYARMEYKPGFMNDALRYRTKCIWPCWFLWNPFEVAISLWLCTAILHLLYKLLESLPTWQRHKQIRNSCMPAWVHEWSIACYGSGFKSKFSGPSSRTFIIRHHSRHIKTESHIQYKWQWHAQAKK